MTLLHFSIRILILDRPFPHFLRAYLTFFNLAVILLAIGPLITGRFQAFLTISINPGWSIQIFSNLKIAAFGIDVEILTTHGTWSEVDLAIGLTIVFGNLIIQSQVVKNQSICSRRGQSCIFDHVKLLPFKGSSIKPR
jgi:hypothetical protein